MIQISKSLNRLCGLWVSLSFTGLHSATHLFFFEGNIAGDCPELRDLTMNHGILEPLMVHLSTALTNYEQGALPLFATLYFLLGHSFWFKLRPTKGLKVTRISRPM
jgi:hypothetical protein